MVSFNAGTRFISGYCQPLKTVELWQRYLEKTFGSTFTSCPASNRVISYLQTTKGLKEVKACVQANVPLHGVSQQNVGIEMCRNFWLELEKMKKGAKTGGTGETKSESAEQPDADGQAPEDEMTKLSADVVMEEEDPAEQKLKLLTEQYFDQILTFDDETSFKQSLKERIFPTWRVIFVVNVQTSRVSVAMKYLNLVADAVKASKLERFVIALPVGFLVGQFRCVFWCCFFWRAVWEWEALYIQYLWVRIFLGNFLFFFATVRP